MKIDHRAESVFGVAGRGHVAGDVLETLAFFQELAEDDPLVAGAAVAGIDQQLHPGLGGGRGHGPQWFDGLVAQVNLGAVQGQFLGDHLQAGHRVLGHAHHVAGPGPRHRVVDVVDAHHLAGRRQRGHGEPRSDHGGRRGPGFHGAGRRRQRGQAEEQGEQADDKGAVRAWRHGLFL